MIEKTLDSFLVSNQQLWHDYDL